MYKRIFYRDHELQIAHKFSSLNIQGLHRIVVHYIYKTVEKNGRKWVQ